MGEFDYRVQRQRLLLEAEVWAKGVKGIHVHSFSSMWYDDRPQDTENNKSVTDTEYNNGIITRYQDGKHIHTFGEELTGDALIDSYVRNN